MNNSHVAVAVAVLEQAFREIQRQYPEADPAAIDAFVKAEFHRANAGAGRLDAATIVANYGRAHGTK